MEDRRNNYIGTDFIVLDIDSTDLTMDEVLDKATYKPTISHTSLGNLTERKNNKYCYHLIYCLTETLYGEQNFKYAFSHFSSGITDLVDPNANDCHRIFFTANRDLPNYEYRLLSCNTYHLLPNDNTQSLPDHTTKSLPNGDYRSDTLLSLSVSPKGDNLYCNSNSINDSIHSMNSINSIDIKDKFSVKKSYSSSIYELSKDNLNVGEKNLTARTSSFILDSEFWDNLHKLSRKRFISHYSDLYQYITYTPPETTEITPEGIVYADYRNIDYYEIPSQWKTNKKGDREKVKVGIGGRTTRLYVDANYFLLIKPDITKEHWVYEVIRDVYENYDNSDRQFSNHYILALVEDVWKSRDKFVGHPIPRKFRIFKYADGLTRQACVGIVRKLMKDNSIGSIIDINLSAEGNIAELSKMGIKIKKNRFMQFIRDNNLGDYIKTDKQIRNENIRKIMEDHPDASYRELERLCKEQGITVSYETIRELGIKEVKTDKEI